MTTLAAHDARPATGAKTRWSAAEVRVLVAAVLASGMAFIDASGLNVVLPALQADFNATGPQLLWVVSAYSLPVAALLLLGGALGDRIGRRRLFMAGIASFAAASVACGLAPGAGWLIAFRTCQGIAAAFMIPGSLSLIAATFAPERRGAAIGIWSACSVLLTALGPVVGGMLAGAGVWRGLFYINIPLALVALGLLRQAPIDSIDQAATRKIDIAGAVCSVVGLAGINFGLIEASTRGFADPAILASLAIGFAGLLLFVAVERRASEPMLPLELFHSRPFTAACVLTLTFYSSLYGLLFFLSLNLIQVQDYSAMQAGLAQLPVMLPILVLAPVVGRIYDRRGPRLLLALGPVAAGAGFLLLTGPGLTAGPGEFWREFLPPLAMIGLAMGLTVVPLSTLVVNSVPGQHAGLASGINSMLSRLSSVLGAAALGPLVLMTFTTALTRDVASIPLSAETQRSVTADSIKLAAMEPPTDVPPEAAEQLRLAVHRSYLHAFRTAACVCAAVVGLATVIAAFLLRRPPLTEAPG